MSNLEKICCPTCNKKNTWQALNPFRPFCSDRCKLIDLGEWASENRKIPAEPVDPDLLPNAEEDTNDWD